MQRHRRLLIVLADGEHARFLRPAHDRTFATATQLDSALAHLRSSEMGESRPGASFHSGSTAHHAITPRTDPHQRGKVEFAHLVASMLNDAITADEYDELALVAPARTLAAVREGLQAETERRVVGTLAKDLIKSPIRDVWSQVHHWIGPTHLLDDPD